MPKTQLYLGRSERTGSRRSPKGARRLKPGLLERLIAREYCVKILELVVHGLVSYSGLKISAAYRMKISIKLMKLGLLWGLLQQQSDS
jgi:hypothetical protein